MDIIYTFIFNFIIIYKNKKKVIGNIYNIYIRNIQFIFSILYNYSIIVKIELSLYKQSATGGCK